MSGHISRYGVDPQGHSVTIPVDQLASTADTVQGVDIRRIAQLFVDAAATVNATCSSRLYLQATNCTLTVGDIVATGDIPLTAPSAILDSGTTRSAVVSREGNLTLQAGSAPLTAHGMIGTFSADQGFQVSAAAGLTAASLSAANGAMRVDPGQHDRDGRRTVRGGRCHHGTRLSDQRDHRQ